MLQEIFATRMKGKKKIESSQVSTTGSQKEPPPSAVSVGKTKKINASGVNMEFLERESRSGSQGGEESMGDESDSSTKHSYRTDMSGSEFASESEIGASNSWSSGESGMTSMSQTVVDDSFFHGMLGGISEMLYGSNAGSKANDNESSSDDDEETYDTGLGTEESKVLTAISGHSNKTTKKNVVLGKKEFLKDDSKSVFSTIISNTFDSTSDSSTLGQENAKSKPRGLKTSSLDLSDQLNQSLSISNSFSGRKINYNSDMGKLYRAIDTKNWESASYHLKKSPEMAKLWVYRLSPSTQRVQWVFLPIHAVCFSSAPSHLVRDLLAIYPESASIAAEGQKLPLHIACETGASHEIVNQLVKVNPESLYHVDNSGNTPLQLCVFSMNGKNRAKVMKILTKAAAGRNERRSKFNFMGRRNKNASRM